nr:pentatricopeptide repeat-containing protein [Tanacetum cinerariifolium]
MVKPNPNPTRATIIPPTLVNRSFRLPALLIKNVDAVMNIVLVTPTPMVANKSLSLLVTPACKKICGLYTITASMPVACSKKCTPIAASRTHQTCGVGSILEMAPHKKPSCGLWQFENGKSQYYRGNSGDKVEEEAISWVEEEAGNLKSPDKHVVDKCKSHVNKTMDKSKNPVRKIVDKGESLLKKTMNKGKSKVLVDDIPVKKHVRRNNEIVIEENVNPVAMDTDSDSESEKGEDEMIDLRKRKTEAKKASKKSNQFMNDLIRKLRDEGDGITDPFKIVESKVEKYPIHDVEPHWRMQKPKAICCYNFYVCKCEPIAKCRSRPEMLKESEKGLKKGWKLGCRNVIALDGFFLKKPNVDLLGDDLDMPTGNGLTLISDQHKDKDPKTWSRAYFRIDINCEAVKNGFSECFNSVLLRVRNKPLITMLEAMRVIVLERMNTIRKLLESWSEDICPNIHKRLKVTKDQHRFWHVIPTGENLFEVRNGS